MPAGELEVRIVPNRETVVVQVKGEICPSTVKSLEAALERLADFKRLALDLRMVNFMDSSSGVGLLLATEAWSRSHGLEFTITLEEGPPARTPELVGLAGRLPRASAVELDRLLAGR